MDYRRYLKHYGVLGMHWGVRKEEPSSSIKKGSQEHFDKVRKANREILKKAPNANVVDWDLFSKKQSIPKKKPRQKQLSKAELEKRRKFVRNMAIGLGAGVLLAAAGIYYAKNKETIDSSVKNFLSKFGDKSIAGLSPDDPFYNIKNKYSALGIDVDSPTDAKVADWLASWFKKDLNKAFPLTDEEVAAKSAEDIFIKAGQSLSRIKRTKDATIRDGAYLCFDNDDVNRYQAFLPAMWNLKRQQKEGNGYTMNLEALSEIKVASSKKQFDTYVDMILDGSLGGYKNIKTRSAAIETAKNNYNNFALNMVQNEYQLKKLGFDSDDIKDTLTEKNAFLSRIKSLGYDAIVDDNDAGKLSRSPLILLNSSKVKVKSVQPIDSNLIKTSLENIKPMMGESYEDTFKSFDAWKQTPGVLIAIKNGIFQFDSELDKLASNNQ